MKFEIKIICFKWIKTPSTKFEQITVEQYETENSGSDADQALMNEEADRKTHDWKVKYASEKDGTYFFVPPHIRPIE